MKRSRIKPTSYKQTLTRAERINQKNINFPNHGLDGREIDREYLDWIKEQRCVVCNDTPCDPAHTTTVGANGSDYDAIPLCRLHHSEQHSRGVKTFAELYCFSYTLNIRHYNGNYKILTNNEIRRRK